MADTTLSGKYFFKNATTSGAWEDITVHFSGVKVLKIDGFDELGDAVNAYTEQWIDSQNEDMYIVGGDIVRKNVDLSMTLIISRRYVDGGSIDEQKVYDGLMESLFNKDFYLYSAYTRKQAHVICIKSFKPTTVDLHRGDKSYILVTVPLHTLDKPTSIDDDYQYEQIGGY